MACETCGAPAGWVDGYRLERTEELKRDAYSRITDLESKLAASEARVRELQGVCERFSDTITERGKIIAAHREALRVAMGALEHHAHKGGCADCIITLANINTLMKGTE